MDPDYFYRLKVYYVQPAAQALTPDTAGRLYPTASAKWP